MDSRPFDLRGHTPPRSSSHREATLPGCTRVHRRVGGNGTTEFAIASVRLSLVEWATRELSDELGPPARRWRTGSEVVALVAVAAVAAWLLPISAWWTVPVAVALSAWRIRRCPARCSARRLAQRIDAQFRSGSTLEDVAPQLASLLVLHPPDDNARFLLALARLHEEQPLEALLQLAPLRFRHPEVLEVGLANALAQLQVGRWETAATELEELDVENDRAWQACVQQLTRVCRRKAESSEGWAAGGAPSRSGLRPEAIDAPDSHRR